MQMELEGTGVRASIVRPGPTLTGMGMNWDHDVLQSVVDEWQRWGLARHGRYLSPDQVAAAVVAIVAAPRGAHFTMIEVHPEGPIHRVAPDRQKGAS
jgi:NADP-dependent 3-hydroxy acid dehydrogenase YdfG